MFDTKSLAGVSDAMLEEFKYQEQSIIYVTTGAPVPKYFDTVVPIEKTKALDAGRVEIMEIEDFKEGQWIRPVGSDIKKDSKVLVAGMRLDSAEIGILASIGKVEGIKVFSKPKVGLLSTGTELVPASQQDIAGGNGKIRDSNSHMVSSIL